MLSTLSQQGARNFLIHRISLSGDVHPHPGPSLNIIQWNCQGYHLSKFASVNYESADIIMLQETHKGSIKLTGFNVHHVARNTRGGGTAILTRDDLQDRGYCVNLEPTPPPTADGIEYTRITVTHQADALTLSNIYASPSYPVSPQDLLPLQFSQHDEYAEIIAGDFNAHHQSWDSKGVPDSRGEHIEAWRLNCSLDVANDPSSTTRPTPTIRRQQATSPDITFFRSCRVIDWRTEASHDSDHGPINFTVIWGEDAEERTIREPTRSCFYAFAKADWQKYSELLDSLLTGTRIPNSTHKLYKLVAQSMTTAAKLSIPRGKRTRGDPLAKVLQLPHIIALQAKADRHIGHRQYTQIRNERRTAIRAALATSFRDRITKLNTAEPHIWSVLKSVGERTKPPTPPLEFDSRDGQRIVARSNKEKAEALADIYTRPSIGVRKPHRIGAGSNQHNVSTMEVQTAISQLNSGRAPGEDGLYADFFKHIGPRALSLLTLLIRKSLRTSVIPPEWKTSIVIPIPKPSRQGTQSQPP